MANNKHEASRNPQRGQVLVLLALSMVVLLGAAALAIDLAALYLARNEAQRAADAAALAGARALGRWGGPLCNSSLTDPSLQPIAVSLAKGAAIAVGNENLVVGQPPSIAAADITVSPNLGIGTIFGYAEKKNPTVKVVVRRTGTEASPLTFFARYWRIWGDVSAEATAEVYANPALVVPPLPSPTRPLVGTMCVKPWLLPNCKTAATPFSPTCAPYYLDLLTGALNKTRVGEAVNLVPLASKTLVTKENAHTLALPGETLTGDPAYVKGITNCHPTPLYCGQAVSLNLTVSGSLLPETKTSVDGLIQRHDTLVTSTTPYGIKAGDSGKLTTSSSSVVTLPLYDLPVSAAATTYKISGFLQIFVDSVSAAGRVSGRVLGATGCSFFGGTSYTPDSKSLVSDGSMMCPGVEVRLVQTQP